MDNIVQLFDVYINEPGNRGRERQREGGKGGRKGREMNRRRGKLLILLFLFS